MEVIREHLCLRKPRFLCRDYYKKHTLTVAVSSEAGAPATAFQLQLLQQVADSEFAYLEPFYREFNGIVFHQSNETAGLIVAAANKIQELNDEWHEWFFDGLESEDLYDFQRKGIAFATIASSGNFFVVYQGKVYYSDHDGGDDTIWADSVEGFFKRALTNPVQFLEDAGCYTIYFDGKSDIQFVPESFSHD